MEAYNVTLCIGGECTAIEPGRHHRLEAKLGEHLRGEIVDNGCAFRNAILAAPGHRSHSGGCRASSFTARLMGNESLMTPRVVAREGTAGRYVFSAPLWDEDDLSLELRLDFSDDRGVCDCKAGNATILFRQLLSSSPVHITVLPAASGRSAASSVLHEGYGRPKGRWLRANCNGTHAGASAHRRFEERACAAHNTHAPVDLMRRRPWLYVPYRGAHSYRVLPLDFVRGTYWLHEEGDSTILRGEKEDLVWLLYGANITALRRTPVICIYAGQGAERAEFKREGCGSSRAVGYKKTCAWSPRAPPPPHVHPPPYSRPVCGTLTRRSHGMLNIFSWELPTGRLIVSYGPAGGDSGSYTHNCTAPGASAQCDKTYGVGRSYWAGVFDSVRAVLKLSQSQPNAIVLAYAL